MPQVDEIIEGLLLELCPKVHFGGTNQVRLKWKEAVDPVDKALGVIVNHEQIIHVKEDI